MNAPTFLLLLTLSLRAGAAVPTCDQSYSDAKHSGLAGTRGLSVTLVDEAGKPADGDVTVSLADGPGSARRWRCSMAAKGGAASFTNLPDRALVVSAADAAGRRAKPTPAPLSAAALTLKLARSRGSAFLYDREKARCADAAGAEGRNPGRVGECGEVKSGAFDAPHDSLSGSVWTGLNLSRRDFSGATLERLTATAMTLDGARFNGAAARGAALEGSMKGARMRSCDLRGARLAGSLEGADLSEADLRGADLSKTDLSSAQLSRARYDEATKLPFSVGRAYRRGMVFMGKDAPKIDEGGSDPSFRAFREVLKTAVEGKDAAAVALRLSKNLRARCGAAAAFSCFQPLADALAGGGVFTDDSYTGFLAPAAALLEQRAGDVLFSKKGQQWEIVEIGRRE